MRRTRRCLGALLAGILSLTGVGLSPRADADPIGDKQAEAAAVASKIEKLSQQIEILAEQYNAAEIELQRVQGEIAKAQAKVDETEAQASAGETQLRSYAVQAYLSGGNNDPLPVLLDSTSGNDVGQRSGYLRAAVGDRQELLDHLAAIEEDLATQLAALDAAEAEAKNVTATLANKKSAADSAVREQQSVLSRVQGELADLVRQEQQRRAEAAARAAAAKASSSRPSPPAGGGSSGGTKPPPPISGGAAGAVALAKQQIGDPYVWGAAGPDAFDCSGFTSYVWRVGGGVSLPHNSAAQYSVTTHIPMSSLQPGDLVFYGRPLHHVALYVGGGQIIHAPGEGQPVRYDSVYYWDALVGAGRVG
jgi:cell wall-associated NlpC family hydrolase